MDRDVENIIEQPPVFDDRVQDGAHRLLVLEQKGARAKAPECAKFGKQDAEIVGSLRGQVEQC